MPGMRDGFQLGLVPEMLSSRMDEARTLLKLNRKFLLALTVSQEVSHALAKLYETWITIVGSVQNLQYVDLQTVMCLQSRATGASRADYEVALNNMSRNVIFKGVCDEQERIGILGRLEHITELIPSIYTVQQDCKYLRQCGGVLRQLILGEKHVKHMFTVRELAADAFNPGAHDTWKINSSLFLTRLKLLYLHIMQNLVALSGEPCLLEVDELPQQKPVVDQNAWVALAKQAKKLGFQCDGIGRLAQVDPDREIARRMCLDARQPEDYEYDESELESFIESAGDFFNRAKRLQRPEPREVPLTGLVGEARVDRRCGRQYSAAYARDRHCYTVQVLTTKIQPGNNVTSLFVWRSIFRSFWDPETLSADPELCSVAAVSPDTMVDMMNASHRNTDSDRSSDTEMADRSSGKNEPQLHLSEERLVMVDTPIVPDRVQERSPSPSDEAMLDLQPSTTRSSKSRQKRQDKVVKATKGKSHPSTRIINKQLTSDNAKRDLSTRQPTAQLTRHNHEPATASTAQISARVQGPATAKDRAMEQTPATFNNERETVDVWLLENNKHWREVGSYSRQEITGKVRHLLAERHGERYLFKRSGKGISLDDCRELPAGEGVYITPNPNGFPLVDPPEEIY